MGDGDLVSRRAMGAPSSAANAHARLRVVLLAATSEFAVSRFGRARFFCLLWTELGSQKFEFAAPHY